MRSARERGKHRIRQATAALSALGVVVTGGAMTLAFHDVAAAVDASSSTTATTSSTTSSTAQAGQDDQSSVQVAAASVNDGASAQSGAS